MKPLRASGRIGILASAVVVLLCAACSARGEEDEALRARVLAEYPAALARLEAAFARVHGSGTRVEVRLDAADDDGQGVTTSDSFAVDRDHKKLVRVREEDDSRKTDFERVSCANPNYSFILTRSSRPDPRIVTSLGGAGDVPEEITDFAQRYLAAPYSVFQWEPISKVFADPTFALESVRDVSDGGRNLLRIEFTYRPDQEYPAIPAWILVSPDEGWVLRQFEGGFGRNSDILRAGVVEYEVNPKGDIPIPRRVTFTHPTYRYSFDFERFAFGPTPEREFTLNDFGLPEVGTTAPRDGWPTAYWLFGLAAVAFATSLVLRHTSRRVASR